MPQTSHKQTPEIPISIRLLEIAQRAPLFLSPDILIGEAAVSYRRDCGLLAAKLRSSIPRGSLGQACRLAEPVVHAYSDLNLMLAWNIGAGKRRLPRGQAALVPATPG